MIFNSYAFLFFFLPITWMLFRISSAFRWGKAAVGVLIVASLFFYGYWNPPYLALIVISIGFNYFCGHQILHTAKERTRLWLTAGLLFDLGLIGYFKYTNFLVGTTATLVGANWENLQIVLPLGISFFTFHEAGRETDLSNAWMFIFVILAGIIAGYLVYRQR